MKWIIMLAKYLLIYLITMEFHAANCEFFSSVHRMSEIMDFEVRMLKNMQKFIGKNEIKLKFLKERLAEYEKEHNDGLENGFEYFENPVNKFLLNKRLTSDWEKIENLLQHKTGKNFLEIIKLYFIEDSELHGALDGILRIQDVYRLNSSNIARGILQGVQYDVNLESRHCFDLGKRALDTNFPRLAYAWLSEALNLYHSIGETFEELDITLGMAEVKYMLGDIEGANETFSNLLSLYPNNEKLATSFANFTTNAEGKQSVNVDYNLEHEPIPADIYQAPTEELYKYSCSGILRLNATEERKLQCGYLIETHPFLLLAPIKVEELHHNPLLVIFHDVLYDKEIEIIKKLANDIERAKVFGGNSTAGVVSNVRTSQFQFMPVTVHPILATIDRRVEDMTNLNMRHAEEHQFANYGVGGHYGPHHDYFGSYATNTSDIIEYGERIATVLFYLSDVEQGGGTGFPYIGQLTMPKKGSAVFWYNLHDSGDPDVRTLHGACPIIVGSKWVQNRWIRVKGQDDRRPCLARS